MNSVCLALGLDKRLEISKELICECVTVPGCCCCMPLLYNHLMDSHKYVCKNTLLAAKGDAFAPPLPPLNQPLNRYHEIWIGNDFVFHSCYALTGRMPHPVGGNMGVIMSCADTWFEIDTLLKYS